VQPDLKKVADNDDWLKPNWFIALLALLVLASFPQILLGYQAFVFRDFGNFSYPIAHYLRESFWRGEIPLWNPLNYCGLPFLAQWNTQALYPPALFYLIFPLSWSLGVFCLLHLFWGGLGMFLLTRCWTQNHFAAAFAGVVFAFNGLMLNRVIWPATIAGLAWMPWVVWLTVRAWREGGKMVVLAALAGALQMLSGAVEVIALTWLILGTLGLVDLIRGRTPRGTTFLRAAVVVLLITGLSAAQLLPFFELLDHSQRQDNFNGGQWPMPATGWLNFLTPLFHYRTTGNGYFAQNDQFWTTSYYVGVGTVVLAVWAAARVRRIRVWTLAALTALCLVLAMGQTTPFYDWLCHHIKAMSLMRFPVKFVILPEFALPLLAAYGLAAKGAATRRTWLWLWIIPVILIAAIIGLAYRFRAPDDDFEATLFNALIRVVLLTLIVGGLFLLNRISKPKPRQLLQVLVLLLVWLDLYSHLPQPPTIPRAAYTMSIARHMKEPEPGMSRAAIPDDALYKLIFTTSADVTQDYLGHRFTLFANCNLLDDIPTSGGFFPLYLRETAELPPNNAPLLNFQGVSEILNCDSNTFWWLPRSSAMPLLTGGQKPVFGSDQTIRQMLASTNFDPRTQVCLPLETKSSVTATNPARVKITPEFFSAQRIEATVETPAPAMVVAAQTYYHPWRAYVDGKPASLLRANFAFQALEVPGGSHHLELVYVDRKFYFGALISLITLAGCLIFLRFGRPLPPAKSPDAPAPVRENCI